MKRGVFNVFLVLAVCISMLLSAVSVIGFTEGGDDVDAKSHSALVRWGDFSETFSVWELAEDSPRIILINTPTPDTTSNVTIWYNGTSNLVPQNDNGEIVGPNEVLWSNAFDAILFNVNYSEVTSDENFLWTVKVTDKANDESYHNLTLAVKNDLIAPRVLSVSPNNYDFKKNESWTITLEFNESESGYNHSELLYRDNDNYVEGVGVVKGYLAPTSCDSTRCYFDFNPNGNMDLANDFNYFDSRFEITDRAGNINDSYFYHVYVDDEIPGLSLGIPLNNSLIGPAGATFTYDISDNSFVTNGEGLYLPEVNCTLYFGNDDVTLPIDSYVSTFNETVNLNPDLSTVDDGIYGYIYICRDLANWEVNSRDFDLRIIQLDKDGPVIDILAPHYDGITVDGNTNLEFNVTDFPAGVDSVWYDIGNGIVQLGTGDGIYVINSDDLNANEINNLQMFANDTVNNYNNTNFTIIVDTLPPTVNLNSPGDNAYTQSNDFTITPVDNFAADMDCTLYINGIANITTNDLNNNTPYVFDSTLPDGTYLWNVSCEDDVNNVGWSVVTRTVNIDTTSPVVTLDYPLNNMPYNTSNINAINGISDFNYTVDETVNQCVLYVDGTLCWVNGDDSDFINFDFANNCGGEGPMGEAAVDGPQNDPYEWYVNCTDLAGNYDYSQNSLVYYDNNNPVISDDVNSSNVDHDSADIIWTVDEITENTVFYGTNNTNTSNWLSKTVTGISVNANVPLSGLDASTKYYYYVYSEDQFGNNATRYNGEEVYYNFTTDDAPADPPSGGGGGSSSSKRECADNKDNDGDGLKDYPEDPGCSGLNDDDESDEGVSTSGACTEDWRCSSWSECIDGIESRTCNDLYDCGTTELKPVEARECAERIESSGGDVSGSGDGSDTGEGSDDIEQFGGTDDGSDGSDSAGVGQATGIFSQVAANWYWVVAALSLIALLASAGWKGPAIVEFINGKNAAKLAAEEKAMRAKLRGKGLIK